MTALRFGLLLAAGLLVAAAPPQRAAAPARYAAGAVQADTLRAQVRAGETLIVALPASVGGAEATYRVVEAPALSWLVDRSFMWRTLPNERGSLPVVFERTGVAPGEVVLLVEIVP
ncbi:hypothetical protein RQM47_09495 [Rubrivirga sp. S365]|uniref:Uncharacterized protein n=1 Tax=Rubrivirga litoralis TaxID=3075598 RepID=A0ABU3BML0_9BACT|nr:MULTISPECIES: hypothetical protein [unclassified Rubrivirga]MDT0630511.1 hypothetical protein [Rubrivirga sp. F394]MDT7856874.1 hypothetical protein [Rubrivirga sp. S365]